MIPKFRAWHKELGRMMLIEIMYFFFFDNELEELELNDPVMNDHISVYPDEIVLMQSTGLKDKNGKEIFEGDVVKMAKDVYSEPTHYEVVRYRGGAYRLESKQHGCELWLRHTNCEIVGNIYENPELLEVKSEIF
nr:MAG TPA: YopX protein [Caudoviricetes sp.]DAT30387.1 MAG TPA: YopX protein [Caudoviricetes sp.]